MPYLLFVLVCSIWGSVFWLMKQVAMGFSAPAVSGLRCLLGALVLAVICVIAKTRVRFEAKQIKWLLFMAFFGYAIPWTLQPFLIGQTGESAFFGCMISLLPLITLVVQIPILGITPKKGEIAGVMIGLACVVLLFSDGIYVKSLEWYHIALGTCVPISYTFANIVTKRYFQGKSPALLGMVVMAIAVPMALSWAFMPATVGGGFAGHNPENVNWSFLVAAMGVLGIVGAGLAMWAFYKMIDLRGPLFAGMVTYIIPCVAIGVGLLDGERVSWMQAFAIGGVLASVILVQWRSQVVKASHE